MTTQCVGPEFAVLPDGTLVHRLAGTPPTASLPATGNGARVDPLKGFWVPAEHTSVQIAKSREDRPGGVKVTVGNHRRSGLLSVTVTNPSPSRPMLCLLTVTAALEHKIAAAAPDNAGYTGWSLELGVDVDVTGPVELSDVITRRDTGVDHEATLRHQVCDTLHVGLAAAQSVIVRAQMGLRIFEFGYGRYTATYLAVRGIGVTV